MGMSWPGLSSRACGFGWPRQDRHLGGKTRWILCPPRGAFHLDDTWRALQVPWKPERTAGLLCSHRNVGLLFSQKWQQGRLLSDHSWLHAGSWHFGDLARGRRHTLGCWVLLCGLCRGVAGSDKITYAECTGPARRIPLTHEEGVEVAFQEAQFKPPNLQQTCLATHQRRHERFPCMCGLGLLSLFLYMLVFWRNSRPGNEMADAAGESLDLVENIPGVLSKPGPQGLSSLISSLTEYSTKAFEAIVLGKTFFSSRCRWGNWGSENWQLKPYPKVPCVGSWTQHWSAAQGSSGCVGIFTSKGYTESSIGLPGCQVPGLTTACSPQASTETWQSPPIPFYCGPARTSSEELRYVTIAQEYK